MEEEALRVVAQQPQLAAWLNGNTLPLALVSRALAALCPRQLRCGPMPDALFSLACSVPQPDWLWVIHTPNCQTLLCCDARRMW